MKKNRLTIIAFLALAACAVWLIWSRSTSTLKGELRDFAYADTANINRIFLADRQGNRSELVRKPGGTWRVNDKYDARTDMVNNLLKTICQVEVRSPVGKNLYNNTMKLMAARSVKVEIYAGDEVVKTYYVGHPTADNLGTFMYMEGSTVPFITHIPGFDGFLSTRYVTAETEWRDRSIYRYDPRKITGVEVKDLARPERSFRVSRNPDSTYSVILIRDEKPVQPVDINSTRSFLASFQATFFDRVDYEMAMTKRDSITGAGPFALISVKLDDGSEKSLTCYRKPVTEGSNQQYDPFGKEYPYDMNKFYAFMTGDTSLLVCQYFHFDRIFRDPSAFKGGPATALSP